MAISRTPAKVFVLPAALGLCLAATATMTQPAAADQNQAIQKYNAKDYQGALNEFKAVITRDPKNALCRYYMALCNQCLARVDEAKKDYKWVVDNGPANLKGQAQTGLSQLERVNVRTGGSSSSTPSSTAAATTDSGKPGTDLIEHSKDANAKDAGKTASATGSKSSATQTANAGAVDKVLNFFSESSRQSQLSESAWDETKSKYGNKINFQKVNIGDPLCDKYGVSEFPTFIILDKNGKTLGTQTGQQSTEALCAAIDTANAKK